MIKKVIKYILKFISFIFQFNPIIAIKLFVIPIFTLNKSIYYRNDYKHRGIKGYLRRKFRKNINSFKNKYNEMDTSLSNNYPVWFIWWQGEEAMPAIVKICYQTLKKYSNGHKINLITKDNFHDFISIPDYILKKLNNKQLSITHFSDLFRMCLLYQYGGLWLDSTVLLTGPLQPFPQICSHLGFWTPKDDGKILETKFGARNWIVRDDKWRTFCIYMNKNNILAEFVKTMFFSYLKTKTIFIDYFLFDYFISIAYDALPEVRIMIDSVPPNNSRLHEIYHRLNLNYEYNEILFGDICKNTFFHKLNWKENYKEYTNTGKLTNYGYIINNYPPK